jgi:hypothetical protein
MSRHTHANMNWSTGSRLASFIIVVWLMTTAASDTSNVCTGVAEVDVGLSHTCTTNTVEAV